MESTNDEQMNDEQVVVNEDVIKSKIYMIRGQKVMLDADLAEIYGYTTKAFNQQVKRNMEKFPDDFMFQLTREEAESLRTQNAPLYSRSHFVTLNVPADRGKNIKYNPYAFTEQGIYMLMTVLKGELAVKQSKALIRIFKRSKEWSNMYCI